MVHIAGEEDAKYFAEGFEKRLDYCYIPLQIGLKVYGSKVLNDEVVSSACFIINLEDGKTPDYKSVFGPEAEAVKGLIEGRAEEQGVGVSLPLAYDALIDGGYGTKFPEVIEHMRIYAQKKGLEVDL